MAASNEEVVEKRGRGKDSGIPGSEKPLGSLLKGALHTRNFTIELLQKRKYTENSLSLETSEALAR